MTTPEKISKQIHDWISYFNTHAYILLIITLVLMMVGYPFVAESASAGFWIHLFMSLIIVTGFYTVSTHNTFVRQTFFLGFFTLIFSRINFAFIDSQIVSLIYYIAGLLFLGYVMFSLIISLHSDNQINVHLILGAIAGYMLLGLMGAFVYGIIEILVPGSFLVNIIGGHGFAEYIYFSFVSLTTLGFGDIVPLNAHAQSWSVLFAIAGQMYLMVFIGVIVGKYAREGSKIE